MHHGMQCRDWGMGMDDGEALGVAIESEMVAALMSREELAQASGVSPDTIGRHIRGEQDPAARLRAIARALDVKPQELLDLADRVAGRADRRGQSIAGDVVNDPTTEAKGRS